MYVFNTLAVCSSIVRIRGRMGAVNGGMFKGFILQARHKSADGRMQYIGEYRYTNGQVGHYFAFCLVRVLHFKAIIFLIFVICY